MEAINHNPHHVPARQENLRNVVLALYIMYIAGFFTGGLTFIVALIMAHIKKNDSIGTIYHSHILWYLTVAWVNMGALFILAPLTVVVFFWMLAEYTGVVGAIFLLPCIGLLVLIPIWSIYRICKGLLRWSERREIV